VPTEAEYRALVREEVQKAAYGDDLADLYDRIETQLQGIGVRCLALEDRFYLLTRMFGRIDAAHPWLYARCREVEAATDDHLDLWAREHYKSTIITYAGCIQEILRNPEVTIGIFSHVKPIARKFMAQIKAELETNERLKRAFPEILYAAPAKESPRWSLEAGIVVKRSTNPKEATVEGHGLVDGMPTGAHFSLLVYDDVVTRESVTTPEQIKKVNESLSLSFNLGARGANGLKRMWFIGTRYSFADTYGDLLERKVLTPRIYPATVDGTRDGAPVFLSKEAWDKTKREQLSSTLAAQMLQNPAAGNESLFRKAWLKFADIRPRTLNVYIMADPASSKKKTSDRTAMAVIGIDAARNKYLLDGYHHRMGLAERWQRLRELRKVWKDMPGVQQVYVGYERFGLTDALEYFEEKMRTESDPFVITELNWPRDGEASKYDRIQRLEPDFRNGRFYIAASVDNETTNQRKVREAGEEFRIFTPRKRVDENGERYGINERFLAEFLVYPFAKHDDFLDAMSRVYDMDPQPPILMDQAALAPEVYADGA
jgi:phage terminase large subunit-like protein